MLAEAGVVQGALTDTAALAAVALIGYIFGRRSRQPLSPLEPELLRELERARQIACQLQALAKRIRQDVAQHQGSVARFQSEASALVQRGGEDGWQQFGLHVEGLLGPSKKLAAEMSLSYDQLRRHANDLLTFANARSDPKYGVHTRRALEEHLDLLFSVPPEPQGRVALVLLSFGSNATEESDSSEELLARLVQLVKRSARDADFVARYSANELAVVMPQTSLSGATILGDRLVRGAGVELGCAVWGGVVEKAISDSPQSLLSRADTALYSARTCSEPCLFQHTGGVTRRCHATSEWSGAPQLESQSTLLSDEGEHDALAAVGSGATPGCL